MTTYTFWAGCMPGIEREITILALSWDNALEIVLSEKEYREIKLRSSEHV